MTIKPWAAALLALSLSSSFAADSAPSACAAEQAALQQAISSVQTEYKALFEKKKVEYQAIGDQIQKDADDNKPSTVGTYVKFDIQTDWKDQEFIFDTPSVTMIDQKIILGLPQVTVNQQKWIYDLPATRMAMHKTGQYPEFICDHAFFPSCSIKWSDIMTQVPEFYMERHETILGVPEFAIRNQEIILGIPEVRMERQRIVMGLPQITVKNVTVEQQRIQTESSAFQQKAQSESGSMASAMQAEIKIKTGDKTHAIFQCERKELENRRGQAISQLDTQIQSAVAQANSARTAKADAVAKSSDAVVAQLVATKATINAKFDEVAVNMDTEEKKTLDNMRKSPG